MKYIFFICIFLSISTDLLAQIDNNTIEETDLFQYQPNDSDRKEQAPTNTDGTAIKTEIVTLFGTLKDISDNFPTYSVVPNQQKRSMRDLMDREKDVLVSKYWNGKDVSVKKMNTSLELGKLETDSKTIRIVCRDHSYVDGDRVSYM